MSKDRNNKKGFTLAEIIISMTIIGVIAAITIPALLVATNEKALEAQKKALEARMAQAISQIDDLRVFGKSSGTDDSTVDKGSTMNFLTKGLSKVYRITKICGKADLTTGCNFPDQITTQNGGFFKIAENTDLVKYLDNSTAASKTTFNNLNTEVAGFVTSNGESIVAFYNPKCHGSNTNGFYAGNAASAMCLNIIYDLNGKKEAPNEVGKDVGFLTVFFPKDPDIAAPMTYAEDSVAKAGQTLNSYVSATTICKSDNKTLIIPTAKEGMSMLLNKKLSNVGTGNYIVSGAGSTAIYSVNTSTLTSTHDTSWPSNALLRCVYNK